MPDLPGFPHSPFAASPHPGWALVTGNPRWIQLLHPDNPDHAAYERIYRERTARHHARTPDFTQPPPAPAPAPAPVPAVVPAPAPVSRPPCGPCGKKGPQRVRR